jgi:hypothetical protein
MEKRYSNGIAFGHERTPKGFQKKKNHLISYLALLGGSRTLKLEAERGRPTV